MQKRDGTSAPMKSFKALAIIPWLRDIVNEPIVSTMAPSTDPMLVKLNWMFEYSKGKLISLIIKFLSTSHPVMVSIFTMMLILVSLMSILKGCSP